MLAVEQPRVTTQITRQDGLRKFQKVNDVLERNGCDVTNLITILQQIQVEYRYLPQDILTYIATALGRSPSEIYGVATFYSQFSLEPKGKYEIRLCDGPPAMCGAPFPSCRRSVRS